MTRRERLERKVEKREEWADKARVRSEASFAAASAISDRIPLGQPILVGHHSERRARVIDSGKLELDLQFDSFEAALACFDLFAPAGQAQFTRGVK